jgi:hypothetical protein
MSVLSVQNLQETFVGAVGKARTATQVLDPNAAGYITDGEIVVVNDQGGVVDGTAPATYNTSDFIQIVERNGDTLTWSSKIPYNGVMSYEATAGAQGQEQVYHIGYNPTLGTPAGSLDITSGLDFQLTVIENQDDMMWSEQKKKSVIYVTNNVVNTQLQLASQIVQMQMKKYITDGSSITAAMVNGGTAAIFTGATVVAVTHGSNVIVPDVAISNVGFGAGSLIRLGITGSAVGVGVPVYTVKEPHPTIANAWILDQPYAGPSNGALAVANAGYIATPGAAYGVRFTGKALPFRRDFFKFKRVAFTLQMSGFGATQLYKTQNPLYGNGDGRLVLEEESFSKGFEGALNRMTVPLPLANETFQASATTGTAALTINGVACGDLVVTSAPGGAGNLYNCIEIAFASQNYQTVTTSPKMRQLIKIFGTNGSGQNTGAGTDIQNALNAFMGQAKVGSFTALTAFA